MKNWQAQFKDLRGKDLLLAVKQFILMNPAKIHMENGIMFHPDATAGGTYPMAEGVEPCGTAGCIAGWCCLLTNPEQFDREEEYNIRPNQEYNWNEIQKETVTLLGFPPSDDFYHPILKYLFFTDRWPMEFKAAIRATPGPGSPAYAQVVSDRIDAFIAEHYS